LFLSGRAQGSRPLWPNSHHATRAHVSAPLISLLHAAPDAGALLCKRRPPGPLRCALHWPRAPCHVDRLDPLPPSSRRLHPRAIHTNLFSPPSVQKPPSHLSPLRLCPATPKHTPPPHSPMADCPLPGVRAPLPSMILEPTPPPSAAHRRHRGPSCPHSCLAAKRGPADLPDVQELTGDTAAHQNTNATSECRQAVAFPAAPSLPRPLLSLHPHAHVVASTLLEPSSRHRSSRRHADWVHDDRTTRACVASCVAGPPGPFWPLYQVGPQDCGPDLAQHCAQD
jgi:hypothetical protein